MQQTKSGIKDFCMPQSLKKHIRPLIAGSLLHFLVDGVCICCLYLMVPYFSGSQLVSIFLTYNILAFMTQPFTGLCADRLRVKWYLLFVADILLVSGVVLAACVHDIPCLQTTSSSMLLVAFLLGMGNSCFHVWGGRQTAVQTRNDLRALGVFVSTGVLGLSVGLVFCSWNLLIFFIFFICLLSMVCWRYETRDTFHSEWTGEEEKGVSSRWPSHWMGAAMTVLIAFVMLRSYSGEAITQGLTKTRALVLALAVVSMAGKMFGGWLARRCGIVRSMLPVVLIAMVCFVFRAGSMAILLAGVFAINLTMPVTLYLANVVLKGKEGLAFGLLAAALIPGYLLAIF